VAGRWANAGRVGARLAVLVLGVAGCGDSVEGGSVEAEETQSGEVRCRRPFRLPAAGGLRLVARFPETVQAGQPAVSGRVDVGSREAVRGVAAPAADVFLVRDDQVVAMPMAQDAIGVRWELAAGETRSVRAIASLVSCTSHGGPLPPGQYELYARFVLTPDDGDAVRAFGGPWRLGVR
jgi:hypothetical protein